MMGTGVQELLASWRTTVARAPHARAIVHAESGREHSRQEVWDAAQGAREYLPPALEGRRVVFAVPNGVDWLARLLALLEAGAVAVPLDPTESPARQEELAARIGAAGTWSGDAFEPNGRSRQVRDRGACLIKLTSGSTGLPRLLRFTGSELLADGRQIISSMGIAGPDLNLAVIPCGHSYGLGNLVLPLLMQGTAMAVVNAPLPRLLANVCGRWRPTVFPTVPHLLKLLAESELERDALASLRLVISAGSRLAPEVARAFHMKFGRLVHNFYGSSETGGITYDREGEATLAGRSVGAPLDGVSVSLRAGGRFIVESAAVHTLGNRCRSATGLGRHRPADRGRFNARGELVLLGRAGRLAKVAGRRIDLGEIESLLRSLPDVSDAYARPHPTRDGELAAAVQTPLAERRLRSVLAPLVPPWKIPHRLICLPQFPLSARGKIDTVALTRLLARRGSSGQIRKAKPSNLQRNAKIEPRRDVPR